VQSAQTDSHGNYLITRGPGVVDTNRTWFVRSLGAQSRRVHEGVHALVFAQRLDDAGQEQPAGGLRRAM